MLRRGCQALLIGLCGLIMLGANDVSGRFNRVGHKMICACSCGQVLLECNHVGCPDSARMIGELQTQVDAGSGDSSILSWFAGKYGATVLAAPMRGGFDNVAWIAPAVVFVLATFGTGLLVTVWKKRTDRMLLAAARDRPESAGYRAGRLDMRDRIRREMEL